MSYHLAIYVSVQIVTSIELGTRFGHAFWNLDKGAIFTLVAIVTVTAIFVAISYSVATLPQPISITQ